ncbi:MAG: TCR/Tet family MFS transporter [Xanthomonadales bacterium]|nr:TCR/Tet family MFS transporter [Xanthomonadales bacterium]
MAPRRHAALIFIFITVVLDVLALGLVIPVLPKLVERLAGAEFADTARIYGAFITVFAVMQFLCSPLLGALSDRVGRRPVILVSNLGLGLDYVLMALAHTLPLLFLARVLGGITAASISTAHAYIADITPPEGRARAYGLMGAAFGLGFVLGPALGGVLGHIDLTLPLWVAAGLSFANFLYGYFVLPESLPPERRAGFSWKRANPVGALILLRRYPQLFSLATVGFLSQLAHVALPATFVLYAGYRYGWGELEVGLALAAVGVCSALVQGGLVGRATKRYGERRLLLFGLSAGSLGFLCYALAGSGGWFLAAIPLMALWGFTNPSLQALMTPRVAPTEQGQLQGALQSMAGVAGIIGPTLFAQTWALAIEGQAPGSAPLAGAAFLLAAGLLAIGALLAYRVAHPLAARASA